MVETSVMLKDWDKKKLIYMFATWEYEDIKWLISFFK